MPDSDQPPISSQSAPLPEQIGLPATLVEDWLSIPRDQPVSAPLRRGDLDHLYFSLQHLIRSQDAMHTCLVELTNGRLESAEKAMWESKRLTIESQNSLRQLFTAIMAAVTRKGQK